MLIRIDLDKGTARARIFGRWVNVTRQQLDTFYRLDVVRETIMVEQSRGLRTRIFHAQA